MPCPGSPIGPSLRKSRPGLATVQIQCKLYPRGMILTAFGKGVKQQLPMHSRCRPEENFQLRGDMQSETSQEMVDKADNHEAICKQGYAYILARSQNLSSRWRTRLLLLCDSCVAIRSVRFYKLKPALLSPQSTKSSDLPELGPWHRYVAYLDVSRSHLANLARYMLWRVTR